MFGKLEAQETAPEPMTPGPLTFAPLATNMAELLIPAHTTVSQLAGLLKKKPVRVVWI